MKNASTKEITLELYNTFLNDRKHQYAVHNTQSVLSYCGESDFISVNNSGNIYEVEVKISRADFKNDFTKKDRHQLLSGKAALREFRGVEQSFMTYDIPNYFYYAMPEGVVKIDEIPLYCGVLFAKVQEYYHKKELRRHIVLYEARKPKKLTDRKVDDRQVHAMLRCQSYKWAKELSQ